MASQDLGSLQERRVRANGVDFRYLEVGEGPLALCLHGFPDSAWTWRTLAQALARAGFRSVAPWMRGYAPSGIPADGNYQVGMLVKDAIALHEGLGGDSNAVLVGHDWGAYAAYGAAAFAPDRWRRVVTMSVPPPAMITLDDYDHVRRVWHFFFFQSPLAETTVTRDEFAFIERLWRDWSPGFAATEFIDHAKDAIRPAGHLTAALGYYRAMFDASQRLASPELQAAVSKPTLQPTLYIHGARDGAMAAEERQDIHKYLGSGSERLIVPDAGHFVHLERPEIVVPEIVRFLSKQRT